MRCGLELHSPSASSPCSSSGCAVSPWPACPILLRRASPIPRFNPPPRPPPELYTGSFPCTAATRAVPSILPPPNPPSRPRGVEEETAARGSSVTATRAAP
uniref:Uncharacterized protein n=1 Tax=Oryza brachyantha TaxID=4533 RepID=J3LMA2_ORYBR